MSLPKDLVPVAVAFQRLTGRRPNSSTIYRWATRGSNGVVLRTWEVDGQLMTEIEAVEYFLHRRERKRPSAFTLPGEKSQQRPRINERKVIQKLFRDLMSDIHRRRE